MRAAEEREQRFRGLLIVAADAYWEIDEQYRLVAFNLQGHSGRSLDEAGAIGQVPWEVPEFGVDDDTLDLLRAHLEAREPFRDLPVQWLGVPGQVRHFLVSGEPRRPAEAVFLGYWGVARDVTTEHLNLAALDHPCPGNQGQQRRLADAVRPDQTDHAAGRQRNIYRLQRHDGAIAMADSR